MANRHDYEHQELDNDGCYYWFMNIGVSYWRHGDISKIKEFEELARWHDEQQEKLSKRSLFYKGTRLYFTYDKKKYYISWTFYSDDYIVGLQKRLKAIEGVSNLQINWGELD